MSDLLSLIHSPGKEYMCVVGIRLCMYVYIYKTGLYDDRHLKIGIFIFSRCTWMNHVIHEVRTPPALQAYVHLVLKK